MNGEVSKQIAVVEVSKRSSMAGTVARPIAGAIKRPGRSAVGTDVNVALLPFVRISILCALLVAPPASAGEKAAGARACPAGTVLASGKPDTTVFAMRASARFRGHWCERYDTSGISTRSGPYWETDSGGAVQARGSYVESQLEGPFVAYHESGELFLRGFLEHGEWSGAFEIFHENGAPWFQANMRAGRLEGPVATFFPDGEIESETHFQAGREDGLARSFFAASAGGRLQSEAHIEADAFVGEHRLLDRNGQLIRKIDWNTSPIDWRRPRKNAGHVRRIEANRKAERDIGARNEPGIQHPTRPAAITPLSSAAPARPPPARR